MRSVLDTQVASIDRRISELHELRGHLVELAAEADALPPAANGVTCKLIEHARAKSGEIAQSKGLNRQGLVV